MPKVGKRSCCLPYYYKYLSPIPAKSEKMKAMKTVTKKRFRLFNENHSSLLTSLTSLITHHSFWDFFFLHRNWSSFIFHHLSNSIKCYILQFCSCTIQLFVLPHIANNIYNGQQFIQERSIVHDFRH